MTGSKKQYTNKMQVLEHLRKVGGLSIEDEDGLLDELDKLWDECSDQERRELRIQYSDGE